MQTMHGANQVDTIYTSDGEIAYRNCSQTHHHHLICRQCSKVTEVDDVEISTWTQRIAREHGFQELEHFVEVYGICPQCQQLAE